MTITLQIEKKEITEQEVEIQVPCFFRNTAETTYVGLLDEKTVIEIIYDQYERSIRNFDATVWNHPMQLVKDAYSSSNYTSCTETEFLEKYSEVERAMSLHPILEP